MKSSVPWVSVLVIKSIWNHDLLLLRNSFSHFVFLRGPLKQTSSSVAVAARLSVIVKVTQFFSMSYSHKSSNDTLIIGLVYVVLLPEFHLGFVEVWPSLRFVLPYATLVINLLGGNCDSSPQQQLARRLWPNLLCYSDCLADFSTTRQSDDWITSAWMKPTWIKEIPAPASI